MANTPASANPSRQPFYDKLWMTNFAADYDFKHAQLSYSFSYQDREVERYGDQTRFIIYSIFRRNPAVCTEAALRDRSCLATVPGSFVPLNSWATETTKAQIHELRLTSGAEGRLRWTVGMYYENRDTSRWGQVAETTDAGVLRFDSAGKAIGRIFARLNNGDRKQWAAFGEADYEVVPGVTATAGRAVGYQSFWGSPESRPEPEVDRAHRAAAGREGLQGERRQALPSRVECRQRQPVVRDGFQKGSV